MSNYQETYHIYDKIFKKILTLSSKAVVNLINGLFGTNHLPDSTVTYNWTEHVDNQLRRCLADTILTVNNQYSYHIEAQMTADEDIVLRVFDYSYGHAQKRQILPSADHGGHTLLFPDARVIYLSSKSTVPDEYVLTLDFGEQGTFIYKVPTFKYLEHSIEELNQKKMIILIPFSLLFLRDKIQRKRTNENILALKRLVFDDIIGSIDKNVVDGNITINDAYKLKRLTHKLYEHIYARYSELREVTEMTDESLILDIDILEDKYEKLFAEKDAIMAEKDAALIEKDAALIEKDAALVEKDNIIAKLIAENEALRMAMR